MNSQGKYFFILFPLCEIISNIHKNDSNSRSSLDSQVVSIFWLWRLSIRVFHCPLLLRLAFPNTRMLSVKFTQQIKKLIWIQCYHWIHEPYSNIAHCPFNAFYICPRSNLEPKLEHVSFVSVSLQQFLHFALPFMTLTFWKSTDQLLCRVSLNLGECFLMITDFYQEYWSIDIVVFFSIVPRHTWCQFVPLPMRWLYRG